MEGFSDDGRDVALGHVLGLRWFQLSTKKVVGLPVPAASRDFQWATFDSPQLQVQQAELPVLRGARGTWEPGVNRARCLRQAHPMEPRRPDGTVVHDTGHEVPVRSCLCGFWAYWHLGAQQACSPHVAGLVKGYGKVIQGPLGFRCDTAEIMALVPLAPDPNASLALEAIYDVPVYGTIEALLEMHKAPGTQPALADDYFHRARMADERLRAYRDGQQGRRPDESPVAYARRAGFLTDYTRPCNSCGAVVCRSGQPLCQVCGTVMPAVQARGRAHETAQITGTDALSQLHARREGWAKDAPPIWQYQDRVMDGTSPAAAVYDKGSWLPPATAEVRQQPDMTEATQANKWVLDYIREKFGDGSWWRRQYPDA